MDMRQFSKYMTHLLDTKDHRTIKEELEEIHPADIAELLEELPQTETLLIFRMLPKDKAVDVFAYMTDAQTGAFIEAMTDGELEHIQSQLSFDDRIDLLEEMPAGVVKRIIARAPAEERKLINEFLRYPEESAGSIMTIEYVSLDPLWTVKRSMDYIRDIGSDKETIYTCYVTDDYRKLIGHISLRELVLADDDTLIKDCMHEDTITAATTDDREEVADKFFKYDLIAIPVVDKEHRLTGIITYDDILDVVEDEATEDFHRMAAMSDTDLEYKEETPWTLAKRRIPWLLILMVSATLTGGIINHYNWIIANVIILNSFIPMLSDTGGNTGSQSSTVVIRALATGEISWKDLPRVVSKEFGVAVIAGAVLSFVNFLRLVFFVKTGVSIALLVSATMICTVILSKIMGALLPMTMEKIGLDPALMASSLITTIIDACTLIIYFNLAKLILF